MSEVRLRFAPSPTGSLHVGGLRTALFNYLFAKHHGGKFILRIEDTDQERYVEGAEEGIISTLEWAGISPDEGPHIGGDYGPYRQSERLSKYHEAAETLIAKGLAYKCFCTSEELDEMRQQQVARGVPPKYDGRHRNITTEQIAKFESEGRKAVVRMKIPERDERVVVKDLVRGNVAFNTSQLDDQVIIKSDGFPTYHLAVVVDDHAMGITHILRAEEWLPSTPKHLLLYKWLGYPVPEFAHLPLLLNDDRTKMSKRKGDVAAEDYRHKGYLPDALVNFLALLGWSPGDDTEIMSRDVLLERFSIERVGKAAAVFDRTKLDWMNQNYLKNLPEDQLFDALWPYIENTPYAQEDKAMLRKVCLAVQPALVVLPDIVKQMELFFRGSEQQISDAVKDLTGTDEAKTIFRTFQNLAEKEPVLDKDVFMALMKHVQKETSIKGKNLWAPMRAAITLEPEGPDLFLVVEVFGKEKTLERINRALKD